jgi:prepilin-type N-terminal cleavage/methylation domain-containing protein
MYKKAFTLFELLIVVSLIGIIYSVFTQSLKIRKTAQNTDITNFIQWINGTKVFHKKASVICLVDEKEDGCRFYLDNVLQSDKFNFFKKFDDIRVYHVGNNNDFEEINFFAFEENEIRHNILFKIDIYPNGGHKTIVLRKNDSYILYNSYSKSKIFEGLSEIRDYMFNEKRLLQERI